MLANSLLSHSTTFLLQHQGTLLTAATTVGSSMVRWEGIDYGFQNSIMLMLKYILHFSLPALFEQAYHAYSSLQELLPGISKHFIKEDKQMQKTYSKWHLLKEKKNHLRTSTTYCSFNCSSMPL